MKNRLLSSSSLSHNDGRADREQFCQRPVRRSTSFYPVLHDGNFHNVFGLALVSRRSIQVAMIMIQRLIASNRELSASNEELRAFIYALEADISAGLFDNNATRLSTNDRPAPLATQGSINRLLDEVIFQREETARERDFIECAEHEVNNLIAGAKLQGEIVLGELRGNPLEDRVRSVLENVSLVPSLLQKIREVTRANSIFGEGSHDPIDLVQVCRAVIDQQFGDYTPYAGRIICDTLHCPSLIRNVDAESIVVIFRNLFTNAHIHGAPAGRIGVSFASNGAFTVINRGQIVPPQDLKKLTDKFKRGGTNARGSGIGLYLVDKVVKKLGGTLELDSPAQGSDDGFEVTVHFPE
ncbi:sensor histidine kinase [Rhizobium leguminosarum]|uniref:sensor histidine kinase n=1 Tax=Rhizobium leguminosarum TaxID=384 RepID=UPI00143F5A30|nr:HAMP domain-containing sensor histidine kinase [Rhizobium leguminosarum]NKL25088.1 hypothetical protein [Rhizobium leguminosarum bv. viciae]